MSNPKTLVVFDFDWSLVDEDSDCIVLEKLSKPLRMKMDKLQHSMEWIDMMAVLLKELHSAGITRSQIESALSSVPMHPSMVSCLHMAKRHNADVIIVSDANTIWIDHILTHYGVHHLIDKIITNHAEWDAGNCIAIDSNTHSQQNCNTIHRITGEKMCNRNLCKGHELRQLLNLREYDNVVYVGDGVNDYCPSLQLRDTDVVCVRKGRTLEKLIIDNYSSVRAEIKFWNDADDVLEIFDNVFTKTRLKSEEKERNASTRVWYLAKEMVVEKILSLNRAVKPLEHL
ncbi:549_t:CDS:2 [Paraglomus brasilianum]|uniref:549_t:CDS:1 n=1 Tax=Paraglomus brasilianum TaxID=144538 RepID=A0A9N8ZEH0_9GLOM|nr:549_t:CDS:2 [Paraglomus brasilianum]